MNRGAWGIVAMLAASTRLALPSYPQQRPSAHSQVFRSADDAFQFSYRNDFKVCTAGKIKECIDSYIPACEDDAIVCVVYPAKRFGDTSFGAAAFQVREIHTEQEQMTADVCVTPYPPSGSEYPEFQISAKNPAERIGGILFVHGARDEAAMSHSSSVDVYRTFHRKRCYELSVGQSGTNPDVFDPPKKTLTDEQLKDVDESLTQILRSFRFLK